MIHALRAQLKLGDRTGVGTSSTCSDGRDEVTSILDKAAFIWPVALIS